MSDVELTSCPSCGAAADTEYCAKCGEHLRAHHELTLKAQLEEVFHGLFHLDGRFWRSFRLLITRPGFLAAEYCRGARVRYMKPVQIFLIANLAYFLLQPLTGYNTFSTPLESQITRQPLYSRTLEPVVARHLAATGESFDHYRERFDRWTNTLSRSLLFLMIPVFASLLALLRRRHRRGFGEHLVLATHNLAFQLAILYLPVLSIVGILVRRGWLPAFEGEFAVSLVLIECAWWTFALRRIDGDATRTALGKAAVLSVTTFLIVPFYRYLLFWVTFWPTNATTPKPPSQVPSATSELSASETPAFVRRGEAADYQTDWPDRTHEVVVWKNEFMTDEPQGYRLGEQVDPKLEGVTIRVTKESFGPDDDLRIVVSVGDGYCASTVELRTARRAKQLLARVWSEDDTYPNPLPEWADVSGHAQLNTWIWPEVKPLTIDYTLYGVQEGMRKSVSGRVVVDF